MEPRYRVYENAMRRCIAGLTEYAAPFAAQHLEKQIPPSPPALQMEGMSL